MAAVAGHRAKEIHAPMPAGNEKENIPPQRAKAQQTRKAIHHINGTIDLQQRPLVEQNRHVISPTFAGVMKTSASKPGYFARVNEERAQASARKAPESALDIDGPSGIAQQQKANLRNFGLDEVLKPYIDDTTMSWAFKMGEQQQRLDATRTGIDHKTGRPLSKPGVPTKHDFDKLAQKMEELNRGFDDAHVNLLFENLDDPKQSVTKIVRIGDIKDSFFQLLTRQKVRQKILQDQHATTEKEIVGLKQEIIDDASADNKASKEFEKHLKHLEKQRTEIEAQAKAERAELKEEEKGATAALNKKINELFELI